jgi:hypothetical protein
MPRGTKAARQDDRFKRDLKVLAEVSGEKQEP